MASLPSDDDQCKSSPDDNSCLPSGRNSDDDRMAAPVETSGNGLEFDTDGSVVSVDRNRCCGQYCFEKFEQDFL